MIAELRSSVPSVTVDSRLDRDLALDSLSRVELVSRIEQALSVTLADSVLQEADTLADIVDALYRSSVPQRPRARPAAATKAADSRRVPGELATLIDVLEWHVATHPAQPHAHLIDDSGEVETLDYGALHEAASRLAAGLAARGLEHGDKVAIMLPTGRDYLVSFLGAQMAGTVPVPIYPPARMSQIEEHLRRHGAILANAQAKVLITVPQALVLARLLGSQLQDLHSVVTPTDLMQPDADTPHADIDPEDLAFIQYTSGSTGDPKGVMLTHRNVVENIRSMCESIDASEQDVMVSWLPLYHDMGLIGGWLCSFYWGFPVALMSPLAFLSRPQRWLWAINDYGGTISAAPNFAYELCVKRIRDQDIEGLDLSSWRFALNGAEPVSPRTLDRFCDRFEPFGFRRGTLSPVYGLAECSVGVAFPPVGRGPVVDRIDRDIFVRSGKAVLVGEDAEGALEFVACGNPLPRHEVRVVDSAGREIPDRREGRLQFRGPSTTQGYFHNEEATRKLFDGSWLESGDLAYLADGDIYITGRTKDIIIRAGRNIYPHEVEDAVGEVEGVRKGCVAVFGSSDPTSGTERLVVLAETREKEEHQQAALRERVSAVATDILGTAPDEVVLAPPQAVLKTSSGKIRRAASQEAYERGRLHAPARAVWWQLARFGLSSALPVLRRTWRALRELLFGAYAVTVFGVVALPTWLVVLLVPGRRVRWAILRRAGRALAALTRTRMHVVGIEHVPTARPCVLVCNHQSLLDGLVLISALPIDFAVVAKKELADNPITRLPLTRIGVEWIDRFDARESLDAARRMGAKTAGDGALLFFPEGTRARVPGLLPFRMGAFALAANRGLPVVPMVIEGTRSILRPGTLLPRSGDIRLRVGEPLEPTGPGWDAAAALQRSTRSWMQAHLRKRAQGARGYSIARAAGKPGPKFGSW